MLVAIGLVVVALVVAWIVRRRTRPAEPVRGRNWTVPVQLRRSDFTSPEVPWLIVTFSSATCDSCAATWSKVQRLASPTVAVEEVSWQERRDLHDRYKIDAVPLVLVVDHDGGVQASFVGDPAEADLAAAFIGLTTTATTVDQPAPRSARRDSDTDTDRAVKPEAGQRPA